MMFKGLLKSLSLDWKTRRPEVTLELEGRAEDIEKWKGMPLWVEIKRYREKRSREANAYYWSLVSEMADKLGQTNAWIHNDMLRKYGALLSVDGKLGYMVVADTEEAWNEVCESEICHLKPTSEVRKGMDGIMYRTYMVLIGSRYYDTKQMSRLIQGVVRECREFGIETITPNEMERMMAAYEKHHAKG